VNDPRPIVRRFAALTATLLLAACSNSATGPGGAANFDAQATAQRAQSVTSTAESDPNLGPSLGLVSDALSTSSAMPSVAGFFVGQGLRPMLDPGAVQAMIRDLGGSGVGGGSNPALRLSLLLPDSLMGSTFVWNTTTGHYEVDGARTGAPSNGLRFIYYAIDPITKKPAEPLNELGYIDLTDQSTQTSGLVLGVKVVNTSGSSDVTLVDYTVEGSVVLAGDTQLSARAQGYLSDGTDRLDFTLTEQVVIPAGSSTVTGTAHYQLASGGVTVVLDTDGSFDLDTGQMTSATLDLSISQDTDTALVHLSLAADGTLDGHVDYQGTTVILIGGTVDQPTFSKPDGSALTDQDKQALKSLVDAIQSVGDFADSILGVFGSGA
jgi:hypothetical protein